MRQRNGVIKKCLACSKEYYVPSYRAEKSKCCSVECLNKGQYQSITKKCKGCGLDFNVSNSRANKKFCNLECKSLTSKNAKERRKESKRLNIINRGHRSKYFRKDILNRHNYKCDSCGYNEYDFCLDIHHIDYNPLNNDIGNLALLCVMCHRSLHKGFLLLKDGIYAKQDIKTKAHNGSGGP